MNFAQVVSSDAAASSTPDFPRHRSHISRRKGDMCVLVILESCIGTADLPNLVCEGSRCIVPSMAACFRVNKVGAT